MPRLNYMEDEDGVHVMHPTEEGTLCGTYDSEHNYLTNTTKKIVTCRLCIRLLKRLSKVKCGNPVPEAAARAKRDELEAVPHA